MFVNSHQAFPTPAGDNFNLPALNFTQFLSPYFGLPRQGRHSRRGSRHEWFAQAKATANS